MPTSVYRKRVPTDPRFTSIGPAPRAAAPLIGIMSPEALGLDWFAAANTSTNSSSAWPAANRALAFMFGLADYYLVRKVWWLNTSVSSDSVDVGVYTEDGTRLVSGGGTATSGGSSVQEVDVTDTLLAPGRYWCAMSVNGTANTYGAPTAGAIPLALMGVAQMASAYPLPSTFTPASVASSNIATFGIANRTQVA